MPDELLPSAIQPMPEPQEQDMKKLREEELVRAAEFSQKRHKEDTEVKERVKQRQKKEALLSREATDKSEKKNATFSAAKKKFGLTIKVREKEIAEMKKHREAEQKQVEDQKKVRDDKRKKDENYMQDLNDLSRMKILEQHRVNKLKADLVRAKQKAEYDFRAAIDIAQREEVQTKREIERDSHQRQGMAESDAKAKLYQLEAEYRSKTAALDAEHRNTLTGLLMHSPLEAARGKSQMEAQFRTKKRKLESDHQEKKHEVEMSLAHAKLSLDTEMHAQVSHAELSHRHDIQEAERIRAQALEECDLQFEKKLRDRTSEEK